MLKYLAALLEKLYRILTPKSFINYINSGDALPPPLTREEEQALIARLVNGEADVRETLIERNLRLVVYIARKFENTGVGTDDLVSIGAIGLIKAVNTFDPTKKIKLATYASRCIENEILMYLRRTCKLKLEISLDESLNMDWDGNELLLSDVLGTDPDSVSKDLNERIDRELLHAAMQKLGKREKRIMELRFGLNNSKEYTQKQVADMLGISQSYISRLEKRIIKQLKKDIMIMQG